MDKKKDIERMFVHNNCLKLIPFSINQNDSEGYIYCMETNFFSGYSQPIYKISSSVNMTRTIKEHETYYLSKVKIIRKIKVQSKLFYEYMLMLRLHKLRIKSTKSFYLNIEKITKYFDELEQLIETKTREEIHDYYLQFMNNFDSSTYCKYTLSINRAKELPMIEMNNKSSVKLNLNSDDSGFIYVLDNQYLNQYYNNKIKIIICSKTPEIPLGKNFFIEDINIKKKIEVKYINIAKNMLKQLANNLNIKSFYYIINDQKLEEILNIIQKYFSTYSDKFQINFAFEQRALKF